MKTAFALSTVVRLTCARVLVPAQSASFENCYKIPRNPLCTRKMVNEKKWLEDKWKVKITRYPDIASSYSTNKSVVAFFFFSFSLRVSA